MSATKWFLILSTLAVVGIDIYWAVNQAKGDTISEVIQRFSNKYWIIAVGAAFLGGHLFWGRFTPNYIPALMFLSFLAGAFIWRQ